MKVLLLISLLGISLCILPQWKLEHIGSHGYPEVDPADLEGLSAEDRKEVL